MKFCFKLGKSASGTFELIRQACGDDALSRTRVFELHKMFKEGRDLVGAWTTARTDAQVAKVNKVLDSERLHLTFSCFREMERELKGLRFDSIEAVQAATTKA